MKRSRQTFFILAALLGLTTACASPFGDGDYAGRRGTSPGSGKADGDNLEYEHCASAAALSFLNASNTDQGSLARALEEAGANNAGSAAEAAISSRNGEDQTYGTPDDEPFSSIGDLLHPATGLDESAVRTLVDSLAEQRCDDGLGDSIEWAGADPQADFMHAGTNRDGNGGWSRDNAEIEVAFTVRGVAGSQMHAALEDRRGFRRMRTARIMEAFNYGLAPDEMPWSRRYHAAREGYPLVAVTIESDRYTFDSEEIGGQMIFEDLERRLNLGTDLNTDIYYDTQDFTLLRNEASVRARVRWDQPDCIRRVLIAAKFGSGMVDPISGIKQLFKVDVRDDASNCNDAMQREYVTAFDRDVRSGIVPWHDGSSMAPPLREVYDRMRNPNGAAADAPRDERGSVLEDVNATDPDDSSRDATFEEGLALRPMMHLFSVRSRFHFNEAGAGNLDALYARGRERLSELAEYLDAAEAAGRGTRQSGELREEIDAALAEVPETGAGFRGNTREELISARALADQTDERLHRIAAMLGNDDEEDGNDDELDRVLTGAADRGRDSDRVDALIGWRKIMFIEDNNARDAWALNGTIVTTHVMDPFRTYYLENMSDASNPDHAANREAFQAYAANARDDGDHPYEDHFEDFDDMETEEDWEALRTQLELDWLQIMRRQIEAAGSVSRAIGFDATRELYVPASSRSTGNFIIDTMDFTEFLTNREWGDIDEAQRTSLDFDPRHVLHTTLVNEAQIELGSEEAYVNRIDELDAQIRVFADANGSVDMVGVCDVSNENALDSETLDALRACEGAREVLSTYQGVLSYLAELKGETVLDRLEDIFDDNPEYGPMPTDMSWGPSERSKGETSLLLLTGRYY